MPHWTESDFMRVTQELAQKHVKTQKSLTDLAEKVAREEALNPEQIRTLTRMTNVAAFREIFNTKTGSDRMVEYQVGDPEEVIRRIHEKPVLPETANVENDKLASYADYELPDMMQGRRYPAIAEEEKVASAAPERLIRKDIEALKLRQVRDEFEIEKIAKFNQWETCLQQLTTMAKRAQGYGRLDMDAFEKDACAQYGDEVAPELHALRENLGLSPKTLDGEKVAHWVEHHLPDPSKALDLMGAALQARKDYLLIDKGIAYIDDNMPKLG